MMKDQRGVTLIELLVVILVMGIIFVPISNLVMISLKTEKEVSIKNDVQREARLIMEYVTEQMRDSKIEWDDYGSGSKRLINQEDSSELLDYQHPNGSSKGIMKKNGVILSENIAEFSVDEDPDNTELLNVKLIIEKSGYEIKLQSDIIHPNKKRFQ